MNPYDETHNRFPDETPVLVWYPPCGANNQDRSAWAWLPGSVLQQCGPDEWLAVVEAPELAEPDPSHPMDMLYPTCFRDASELHEITPRQWREAREALAHG